MPVRAVGMIADPGQAEEILASGKADMVAMARAFLDNPRWVWHAAERFGVDARLSAAIRAQSGPTCGPAASSHAQAPDSTLAGGRAHPDGTQSLKRSCGAPIACFASSSTCAAAG